MTRTIPAENQRIWIQGYEFYVRNIRIVHDEKGQEVLRYEGHCTENPVNNGIRGTGYDGGIYGHRVGWRVYSGS